MKIGIDLGGTKTEGILIDDAGKELARNRIKTEKNYDGTISGIISIVKKFETDIKRLGKQTSDNLLDIRSNIDESTRRTNLAYSGEIERKEDRAEKRIKEQAMGMSEDLTSQFGLKMGEIMGGFESEKSRLKAQKRKLEYEKSLYSDMSRSRFLGIF